MYEVFGFWIRVISPSRGKWFSEGLHQRLLGSTNWSLMGGYYKRNFISLKTVNQYDASRPMDFEDNYSYSIDVNLEGEYLHNLTLQDFDEEIEIAREIMTALEDMGCSTKIIFSFNMPNGQDPVELL